MDSVNYKTLGMLCSVPGMDLTSDMALTILGALGAKTTSVATVVQHGDYIGGNKFIDASIINSINDSDYVNYIFDKYL
jgi:hypothetical protein